MEACSQLLASLCTCLQHMKTLYSWREPMENGQYSLFPSEEHSPQELLNQAENINQYCFYGRCLGFQVINQSSFYKPLIKKTHVIICSALEFRKRQKHLFMQIIILQLHKKYLIV